jgi:FkbM family methyltransferase
LIKKIIWWLAYKTRPFKGKERLVYFFTKYSLSQEIKIKRQDVKWYLKGIDVNEFYIGIRKSHSELLFESIKQEININKSKIFWDIGANIGSICLPLLKKNSTLKAILFEPSPSVLNKLIKNLSLNQDIINRSKISTFALSKKTELAKFYESNQLSNSGVGGLKKSHTSHRFSLNIQTYSGDDLIFKKKYPMPDIIKIDVEGFEYEVLYGLKKTLKKYHPTIFFEHCLYRIKERMHSKKTVIEFLKKFNYVIYNLKDKKKINDYSDLNLDTDFMAKYN